MSRSLKEALENRRSYYQITNSSPIPDQQIREILEFGIRNVPSAFNSQSTRVVLLLRDSHKKLWAKTKSILKVIVPPDAFVKTAAKIDKSFASGYGTVLFFEDLVIVNQLQETFPTYKEKFPIWAQQTSAMHQLVIWSMLEEAGFGVSLQHYNPLIDEMVQQEWQISSSWELVAQMPFGIPVSPPDSKESKAVGDRVLVFE